MIPEISNAGTTPENLSRNNVVGTAIRYGLDGPGIESRWRRARYSAFVHTGPKAHPASCTMGTGSISKG